MKKTFRFMLACIAIVLVANFDFSCAAARYYTYAINEDFSSAKTTFLAPGDIDADGNLNSHDIVQIIKFLLNEQSNEYADVNGDEEFDIRDLVRIKKNSTAIFLENGVMNLAGKSTYNGNFVSRFNTGVSYQLKCNYKSNSTVLLKIKGAHNEKVFELASTSGEYDTFEFDFTTPFTIDSSEEVKLEIVGIATIDSFYIKQMNTDNEYNVG